MGKSDRISTHEVQNVADELRGKNQSVGERDDKFKPPQGVSDDPVKHSIKKISEKLSGEHS